MSRRAVRAFAAVGAAVAVVLSGSAPAVATPGPGDAPEYWFDSWRVESLWASGARGQGVTIAEIDTGVARIPQLAGRVLPGTDFGSGGGDGRVDRELDEFGHGTAMASIMVARPGAFGITGLAPGAKILPIAVPLAGTTDAGQPDHLPEAIRYAADHGAKIISMSLGGKRDSAEDDRACSDDEQAAVYHAIAKGAVVLAAVGNTGPSRNAIEDPAVCLGVVSVGAVDASGRVADFSTRQPYLTLVAPGVDVPSLGRVAGQAYSGDGSSQATALTSAALALVWSKYPRLTGRTVVARVLATLDDRRRTPSTAYGYGLLDAYLAVTRAVPADAPNPVYAAAAPFVSRAAAVAAAAKAAPKPAPAAPPTGGTTGVYSVGRAPRLTATQVLVGAGVGGAGLLLLAALLVGAVASRRRTGARQPATDGQSDLAPAPDAGGADGADAGSAPVPAGDGVRPRPRPRPAPAPVRPPVQGDGDSGSY